MTISFAPAVENRSQITPSQLRAARAYAGVRQTELAAAAKITAPRLVALERGYAPPSEEEAERLRLALQSLGIAFLENGGVAPVAA